MRDIRCAQFTEGLIRLKRKKRCYYYYDELTDDFAGNNIKTKQLPPDYEYLPKSRVFRFFRPAVYHSVRAICLLCEKLGIAMRVRGKKAVRKRGDRARGCFIYGNHTSAFSDAVTGATSCGLKECYVVCNPDALSVRGIRTLVRFVGGLPTPSTRRQYADFGAAVEALCEKGYPILIYPEAHIWPKYSGIRDFSDVSFAYPVKLNAPCFAKTTVYRKKKNGRTKGVMLIDGPFYPDASLGEREARAELCARVKAAMRARVEEYASAADDNYVYTKVDSPSEMRAETVRG